MNIKRWSKLSYRFIASIYTLGISYISLIPLNGMNLPNFNYADKVVHFFLYFFLTLLWLMAYPSLWKIKKILFLILIFWGIFIEILQAFYVPGRSGDIMDALFNAAGVLLGLYVYNKFSQNIIIHKQEISN